MSGQEEIVKYILPLAALAIYLFKTQRSTPQREVKKEALPPLPVRPAYTKIAEEKVVQPFESHKDVPLPKPRRRPSLKKAFIMSEILKRRDL